MRLGALESGGTKMVCAVGDEKGRIFEQMIFPTKTPEKTIPQMIEYFKKARIEALGIASFGPLNLNPGSASYGFITNTPKSGWENYNILGVFKEALSCPVGLDTDVNGSVLGEVTFGQAKGKSCVIYVTIGTGIGAGIFVEGRLLHGMLHPEAGHVLIRRRNTDTYQGKCRYHTDCLEGLASGPAIEERWGKPAAKLKQQKEVWDLEAYYIAQALSNYILTLSPQMIILGGGVMQQEQLFPMIRSYVKEMLNGYVNAGEFKYMESYIVPASLNGDQGILGCLELARRERGAE